MRNRGWMLGAVVALVLVAGVATAQTAPQGQRQGRARTGMQRLGWRLAVQAWTFRELSLFETIDVLKSLGVRSIEMFPGQKLSKENPVGFDHNATDAQIEAVKAKLTEARVRVVNYGVTGLGTDDAANRKVFDFAKKMGITVIVAEPAEEAMSAIDKLCTEYSTTTYKVRVAIHNHPKPSHYWNSETVLKAVAGVSKNVGACADTGHWVRSGLDPVAQLKALKGRVVSLHFKDLNAKKDDAPWGTGLGNARAQLEELKAQKCRATFSIEYESTTGAELIENVRKCVAWFRKTCDELAPPATAVPAGAVPTSPAP